MRKLLTKLLDCFFLLRIALLAPVWTILILGWVTAHNASRPGGVFLSATYEGYRESALWIALVGFSLIVASIYVINQIVDIESDRINHKLFLLPHGFVSVRAAWILAALCAAGGMLTTVYFDIVMTGLFFFGLLLGFLYNLPPARLKNNAMGGVLANFLGHGMCTYLVGWYAAKWITQQDVSLLDDGLVPSLAPGFANAAVFLATTIPDAEGDRATGKRTFCVAYGEKTTAVVAALFCLLALALTFAMEYNVWAMAAPAAISLALFVYHAMVTRKEMAFQTFKWPVFLLSAFVSVLVPTYGILILCTFFGSRAYYRWRFGIDYPTFKSQ